MPYRRRRGSKKYGPWKRVHRIIRGGTKAMSLAGAAYSGYQSLRKLINVEYKTYDTENVSLTPNNVSTIAVLSNPSQGDDMNARSGRSIKASSIYVRARLTQHASAVVTTIRCIILIDHQCDGALPTESEILDTSATPAWLTVRNNFTENPKRFTMLVDRTYDLDSVRNRISHLKVYKKLGHHVKFRGTAGATGDLSNGHIFILWVSNETTNTPGVLYTARFQYIDN